MCSAPTISNSLVNRLHLYLPSSQHRNRHIALYTQLLPHYWELTFDLLLQQLAKLRRPINTIWLEIPVTNMPIGVVFLSKKGNFQLAKTLPDIKKVEVHLVFDSLKGDGR
jgi:hypothetical protein